MDIVQWILVISNQLKDNTEVLIKIIAILLPLNSIPGGYQIVH
jgi:hypothetical protein